MAEKLADVGANLALFRVNIDEVKEQDVNARVMPPEMFERLTQTIKKEGRLESLPFTVAKNGHFELISGHHRIRAARQAGLAELFILADTRNLPRSSVVAKQLAHNKISGEDDKQTLKKLYAEMDTVEALLESYVTPTDFDTVEQLAPAVITDLTLELDWKHLSLIFLAHNFDKFEDVAKKIPKEANMVGVVSTDLFERFRKAVLAVGKVEDVRSIGAIMTRLVEIAEDYVGKHDNRTAQGAEQAPRSKAKARKAVAASVSH